MALLKKIVFFYALLVFSSQTIVKADNNPVVNEFLASNSIVIADEDGDYSDWIEIYNPSTDSINVFGFALSDEAWNPYKWSFPDTILPPESFMLIFASGKNRNTSGEELHLNFKINTEQDYFFFVNNNGQVLDEVFVDNLPTDISFGRYPDGESNWVYFSSPSPGFENSESHYNEILSPPQFSDNSGFYSSEFELHIVPENPDEIIVYTIDGSKPDINNLAGSLYQYKKSYPENPGDEFGDFYTGSYTSHVYDEPILIFDKSNQEDSLTNIATTYHNEPNYFPESPVKKASLVRAKVYKEGALPSETVSSTFFVDQYINSNNLILSLQISENHLFDYYDGIYCAGVEFDNWRENYPNFPVYGSRPANYWRRGEEWEFPASIEVFDPQSLSLEHQQNIGVRIHGGWTRAAPRKSFRIYARNKYGDSRFNYNIFPEQNYESYNRFIIRNSGNDWPYTNFRDALMQTIVKDLNVETQAFTPATMYINGEFWGIHNVRERYDKHYLERVFGIDPENIDYLTNNDIVKYGNATHYQQLRLFMAGNSLEYDENYQTVKTKVDVENFTDYQISNIFFGNKDWPRNNVDFWRVRTEYDSITEYAHDGRWRWLLYDTDFGFGLYWEPPSHNTLEYASQSQGQTWENPLWATFMLRHMIKNQNFVNQFVNRFADLLNTIFLPSHIVELVDEFKDIYEPDILDHVHRWNRPGSVEEWEFYIDEMISYINQRPDYQRQHIKEKFDIDDTYNIELDVSNPEHGYVRINTIDLLETTGGVYENPYPWTGVYFKDIPVEIEAMPYPGYRFVEWQNTDLLTSKLESNILPEDNLSAKAIFEPEDNRLLLYYWHFNDLADETLSEIPSDSCFFNENGIISYPGSDNAYMDRVSDGTTLNAIENIDAGYALRVRNPSVNHKMLINISTTGFEEINFSYAFKRSPNGARVKAVYYTVDSSQSWIRAKENILLKEDYEVCNIDFRNIPKVNNNCGFKVKFLFGGTDAESYEGNNRYDNILVTGVPLPETNLPPYILSEVENALLIENSQSFFLNLNDVFADPNEDSLIYTVISENSELVGLNVDSTILEIIPFQRGASKIILKASDGHFPEIQTSFNVLVYPEAAELSEGDFIFDYWSSKEEELTYPENILFLQSNISHPAINNNLNFAYFIPNDEYVLQDNETIGFPYNNIYKTRINGLNQSGISFVNTGTERDLGGLVLAINTLFKDQVYISWINETINLNSTSYGIRLLFRTNPTESFIPLIKDGQPVDFIATSNNNYKEFKNIPLPDSLINKEYLQLMWRYFPTTSVTEKGSEIRLDNIQITDKPLSVEIESDSEISIYPNPASDILIVNSFSHSDITSKIYSITGKLLIETSRTQINIAGVEKGTYFIVIKDIENNVLLRNKFVKL